MELKKKVSSDRSTNQLSYSKKKKLTITYNGKEQNRDAFSDKEFTTAISAGGNVMISLPTDHTKEEEQTHTGAKILLSVQFRYKLSREALC